jgi:aspartate kinase
VNIPAMATPEYESLPAFSPQEAPERPGTVVMKFGGTSVADVERLRAVAGRIVAAREGGNRVVAVVSAMGDMTDEWVRLAHEMSSQPRPREVDMLISVGERISCALCAIAIHDLGHEAISLTGSQAGIVTDTAHGNAKIVDIRARRIHEALDDEKIVLVAGFQGVSTDYDITTLGRGGSDTTAVALAAALGAEACEIYTDVDGVQTADPRVVPGARKLHAVSYEEMLELAAGGAKVLQLRSVEIARSHRVKLHVRSSFSPDAGTWIREEDERMLEKALISGVTHTVEEHVYAVDGISAAGLFEALAEAGVNVDTVLQTREEIVFSAPTGDGAAAESALDGLGVRWTSRDDLGKVSLVGAGMKSHPGVAAKAFATLEELGIEPEILTTSPIKIACFIPRGDVVRAVQALHAAFELDSEQAERQHA